jgi:hypothetical protein
MKWPNPVLWFLCWNGLGLVLVMLTIPRRPEDTSAFRNMPIVIVGRYLERCHEQGVRPLRLVAPAVCVGIGVLGMALLFWLAP